MWGSHYGLCAGNVYTSVLECECYEQMENKHVPVIKCLNDSVKPSSLINEFAINGKTENNRSWDGHKSLST